MPEDVEFKETHTDEKSTVEYKDLKAETKHKDKKFDRKDTEDGYQVDWEISSNGDKIKDQRANLQGVKRHLKDIYKKGQERLGKKAK